MLSALSIPTDIWLRNKTPTAQISTATAFLVQTVLTQVNTAQ